jgi:hypothetical protein
MITLVNGHVLIPHAADWSVAPTAKRTWRSEVTESLLGGEVRQALRAVPRRTLTFSITATSLGERSRLDARIDAATKSGLACVPFWGRGCPLAAAAQGNSLELAETAWNWTAGDYGILLLSDLRFDVVQVDAVHQASLTLKAALGAQWHEGQLLHPLLFGKLSTEDAEQLTAWYETVSVTVTQIVGERSVTLGVIPAARPGIGQMTIGSTFKIA